MASPATPVVLDGSYGEGAGALMRTALVMSAMTMQPIRIENVRGGSPYSGVSAEDISLISVLKPSCAAEATGVEFGSVTLSFLPTQLPTGVDAIIELPENSRTNEHQNANILLTSLIPVLATTGRYSSLEVRGETHGHNALSYDCFAHQTLACFRRFGLHAFLDLQAAGFGRASKGLLTAEIEPSALHGVQFRDRGALKSLHAIVTTAELPDSIGDRGASHLERMAKNAGLDMVIDIVNPPSMSPGAFVSVIGTCENGFGTGAAMGVRGLRIESVAQNAFEKFLQWYATDATVDEYLADQISVLAATCGEHCSFKVNRLTERLLTTIWVIRQFMPIPIVVKGSEGGPGTVTFRKA